MPSGWPGSQAPKVTPTSEACFIGKVFGLALLISCHRQQRSFLQRQSDILVRVNVFPDGDPILE
jgi:hypothetical protein